MRLHVTRPAGVFIFVLAGLMLGIAVILFKESDDLSSKDISSAASKPRTATAGGARETYLLPCDMGGSRGRSAGSTSLRHYIVRQHDVHSYGTPSSTNASCRGCQLSDFPSIPSLGNKLAGLRRRKYGSSREQLSGPCVQDGPCYVGWIKPLQYLCEAASDAHPR